MGRPAACFTIPIAAGRDGLEALRRRTRESPWFAVATGVLHGGEVEYARAQAAVELVADAGAEAFLDPTEARRLLAKAGGAQLGTTSVADRLSAAARCYVEHSAGGEAAKQRAALDALTACVRREKTGIGPKAGALMREYLGDDDAVAVDRHIFDAACRLSGHGCKMKLKPEEREALRKRGVIIGPPDRKGGPERLFYRAQDGSERPLDVVPWKRGGPIGPREFRFGEKVIRALARDCGVSAAAMQVALWLHSACLAKGRGVGYSMPLTRGATFPCGEVVGQRTLFGGIGALAGARGLGTSPLFPPASHGARGRVPRAVRVRELAPSVFVTG